MLKQFHRKQTIVNTNYGTILSSVVLNCNLGKFLLYISSKAIATKKIMKPG